MNKTLNIVSVTVTSFLAYFILSAIISPLGIVSGPIATHYDVSITAATAIFSSLTTGIFIGSLIAVFVFDYLRIKSVVLLAAFLIASSLLAIYAFDSFAVLPVCLFLAGTGCGVALSSAAVVITKTYAEQYRASMLLLTDSSYSAAATFSSFLAVYLLSLDWHWWSSYLLALAALAILILLAVFSTFPESPATDSSAEREDVSVPAQSTESIIPRWPSAVYVCGLSLLVYLLGLVTIYSWIPNYAQSVLSIPQDQAGNLVGRLFSGMFFGQLIMFVLVMRLSARILVFICMLLATLMTISIWTDLIGLGIDAIMFGLGLIGGGILKVAISYGTTLTQSASPKMVSYLLFNTALGTAIAPALSAWVVEGSDIGAVMVFASACYGLATILLLIAYVLQNNHQGQPAQSNQ
ncbi:MAG: MFS transporter TsgA [Pseudomonadota bacterium]